MNDKMRQALEVQSPFFIPVWRRVVTVGVVGGWAMVEVVFNSPFWGLLFGAAAIWLFHQFFIAWDPAKFEKKDEE